MGATKRRRVSRKATMSQSSMPERRPVLTACPSIPCAMRWP
ncbi:Uncharacterised protein [Bordetella pertussis]|nr:Uncharacterised protein [Bordetella pertussis]